MKGSGALVASVVAASTVALTSSSSSSSGRDADMNQQGFSSSRKNVRAGECSSSDKEKFAPRFDGLRFIETLVTAHR